MAMSIEYVAHAWWWRRRKKTARKASKNGATLQACYSSEQKK
jgi:hypothetical protein